MLTAIKLRQKGATKVSMLPSGVFRYMLEYKFPNELLWRYSQPNMQIEKGQDKHFPAIEKLSYNNQLAAVVERQPAYLLEYQFTLLDGANCGSGEPGKYWSSLQISQPQAQLQQVKIWYDPNDQRLLGLKFYGKDGAVVLETGHKWPANTWCKTHTVHLEDGERVIGFKSRTHSSLAFHYDFQLIIGRLV